MPGISLSARVFRGMALCGSVMLLSGILLGQQKSGTSSGEKPQATKSQPPAGTNNESVTDEILTTADGWPIHVTYYASTFGKESPAVILLPGAEGPDKKDVRNRRVWQTAALTLQKNGFAVISVDLRKHGDSLPVAAGADAPAIKMNANDYVAMATADLEAVKAFLLDQHKNEKLNIRKLGVVSVGSSAMVSAAFAVADWAKKPYPDGPTPETSTPRGQDVRALIMYSPNSAVKNINPNTVLKTIKGLQIAVHVVASKDVEDDARHAEKIFKGVELRGEEYKDVRKITLAAGKTRAEGFLEGTFGEATNKDIVAFLTKNLKDLDSPWAARIDRRQN